MTPLTQSEITCFQRCERLWSYEYLERRTGLVPAETLNRGKRIHTVLAYLWRYGDLPDRDPTLPPSEVAMLAGYHARWQRPYLVDVRVNVPFRATVGGVEVCGELDAIGTDPETGDTVIPEHKTTTRDITPGSQWWREKTHTDPQPSMYLAAFPHAKVLYDVLRVPSLRQYEAGKTRKVAETDDEFVARCLAAMSEEPDRYFQRAFVVRLEKEHRAFAHDLNIVSTSIDDATEYRQTSRNPRACFEYGRECEFFAACWQGRSIETYPQVAKNHSEEVLEKWEASR